MDLPDEFRPPEFNVLDRHIAQWTLEAALDRVAQGISTVHDADQIMAHVLELDLDIQALTAIIENAIIEKEPTDNEPEHRDRTRQFDGAGTA